MLRTISLACILFILWISLSSSFDHFQLCLGLFSSVLAALLVAQMRLLDQAVPLRLSPSILFYWLWLGRQITIANIAVAKVILSRRMPLAQQFIRMETTQRSEIGRVILANSITLTPGTISVELRDRSLLVHALTDTAANKEALSAIDRRVSALEAKP